MTDFLCFKIEDWDTLHVTGQQGSFSGRGVAHEYEVIFERTLRAFVSKLRQFPGISATLDMHGPGTVDLSIMQIDAVGHVEFRAKLSELPDSSAADLRLKVDYETVASFARDFEKLIDGTASSATIAGNAT